MAWFWSRTCCYPVAQSAAGLDGADGSMRLGHVQSGCGSDAVRLLFADRMVQLKGGEILLRALPQTSQRIQRPLQLTMAGTVPRECSGRRRPAFSVQKIPASASNSRVAWDITIRTNSSTHPTSGPESVAGAVRNDWSRGGQLPAVAFAVGGIPEWLHDGINGFRAPANLPSVAGLAAAIAKSFTAPLLHQQLRDSAQREAGRFSPERHVGRLLEIFTRVVESSGQAAQ